MPHPPRADLAALLQALISAGVEFIVVGGAAAVLHGAPITTQDLDIVHRRTDENVRRLSELLARLDAKFRGRSDGLRPSTEVLSGPGQLNLATALGPLDPLGALHDGRGYDELLPHTRLIVDGPTEIRVLDLDTLISVKAATGRARDKLSLPILIALRDRGSNS
jgi:hypothetical protein